MCLFIGAYFLFFGIQDFKESHDKKYEEPAPSINAPTSVGSVTAKNSGSPATDASATSVSSMAGSNSGLGPGVRENTGDPKLSNCSLEDPPAIPDGATATGEQMKSAESAIGSYGSHYRDCIDQLGDPENSVGYHRSLAMQTALGQKFNGELQVYKEARTREAGRSVPVVAETRSQNTSMSDTEENGYAVGVTVGRKLKEKNLSIRVEKLLAGIRDEVNHQSAEKSTSRNRKDRESYSLGMRMGRELARQNLPIDVDSFMEGIRDAFAEGALKMGDSEMAELVRQIDAAQPASTGRR